MNAPPDFASPQDFVARIGDAEFWGPYVTEVLERHDPADCDRTPEAGFKPTYPTFVCGEVVVKLFGGPGPWRRSFTGERAAHEVIAGDPGISAPRLLGAGRLYEDDAAPWPYLVTTRMPGVASWRAGLSEKQRHALAVEVGRQVRRLHALKPAGVATYEDWRTLDVPDAARQSSLPPHLVAQVADYLAALGPVDPVFAHGDIAANHVFVEAGRFAGIIDWGDAMLADRHYEIIQIHRDLFDCNKTLLRAFLEASAWPLARDFPRQALGHALQRQAVGLAQHHSMDIFEPIAARFPLKDIATLDELSTELFGL